MYAFASFGKQVARMQFSKICIVLNSKIAKSTLPVHYGVLVDSCHSCGHSVSSVGSGGGLNPPSKLFEEGLPHP